MSFIQLYSQNLSCWRSSLSNGISLRSCSKEWTYRNRPSPSPRLNCRAKSNIRIQKERWRPLAKMCKNNLWKYRRLNMWQLLSCMISLNRKCISTLMTWSLHLKRLKSTQTSPPEQEDKRKEETWLSYCLHQPNEQAKTLPEVSGNKREQWIPTIRLLLRCCWFWNAF